MGFNIIDYQLFRNEIYSDRPLSLPWIVDFLFVLDIHFPNVGVLADHSQVRRAPYWRGRFAFGILIAASDSIVGTRYIQLGNLVLEISGKALCA